MAYTIRELYESRCINVPKVSGIYFVKKPKNFNIEINIATVSYQYIKDKSLIYDKSLLGKKYEKLLDKDILYIGKANCKNGLHKRIKQYILYGYQKSKLHKGGRAIWQIINCKDLIVEFYECHDCELQEKKLLMEYHNRNGTYPLANWRL